MFHPDLITVFIALIGTVDLTAAECHTFVGFSTCYETSAVDMKYSFSVEWWVVNVDHRTTELRRCLKIAQQSPAWRIVENIPFINDMIAAAFEGDVFERVFKQATEYYKSKEFPVDLLVAPELTYTEIYLSFKGHQKEIFAAVDPIMDARYFDEEVMDFFRRYKNVIEKGARIITLIPTSVFDPYLNIFEGLRSNPGEVDPELPPLSEGARSFIDTVKSTYILASGRS